jgi:nicotinamide riboside transporter PnuC
MPLDILKVLEILYTILVIISVYLVSVPKRTGLFLMVIAQFMAVPVFYYQSLYFAMVLMFVLNAINIKGIINWTKKGVG